MMINLRSLLVVKDALVHVAVLAPVLVTKVAVQDVPLIVVLHNIMVNFSVWKE